MKDHHPSAEMAAVHGNGKLPCNNRMPCTCDGCIDGQYRDIECLRLVAARDSEPLHLPAVHRRA
jgi:hypothetical protein